jgi:hypothetical protein
VKPVHTIYQKFSVTARRILIYGLSFFSSDGFKLPDEVEANIEEMEVILFSYLVFL